MVNGIQALSIQKGMNGLTSGTFKGIAVIHCVEDGDIIVHFATGDETVSLVAGDDRTLGGVSTEITINSGTFDLNR